MRVAVFVDFWNFQLSFNTALAKKQGLAEAKAMIEWRNVGPELAAAACDVMKAEAAKLSYEGCYVYTSYNPTTEEGKEISELGDYVAGSTAWGKCLDSRTQAEGEAAMPRVSPSYHALPA